MVKILYGNEPYLIADEVRKATEGVDELSVSEYEGFSADVWNKVKQYPMFSDRQVVIVNSDTINNEALIKYVNKSQEQTDLIVIPKEVDKRTKAFKAFQKAGVLCECNKIDEPTMKKFVMCMLHRENCSITEELYEYFIIRTGYFTDEEINLYTVKNYIIQIAMGESTITKEAVDTFVIESNTSKTFALTKELLKRNDKKLFMLAKHFIDDKENPIGMLSLLLRSFRLAYKASLYYGDKNDAEISKLLGVPAYQFKEAAEYSPEQISNVLDLIQSGVSEIKTGMASPEVVFINTLAKMLNCLKAA